MVRLARNLRTQAYELEALIACTEPGYGAPGHAHCAACCYGTGIIVTSLTDQQVADTITALRRLADTLEQETR